VARELLEKRDPQLCRRLHDETIVRNVSSADERPYEPSHEPAQAGMISRRSFEGLAQREQSNGGSGRGLKIIFSQRLLLVFRSPTIHTIEQFRQIGTGTREKMQRNESGAEEVVHVVDGVDDVIGPIHDLRFESALAVSNREWSTSPPHPERSSPSRHDSARCGPNVAHARTRRELAASLGERNRR
jgi:hypothetical protein